MNLQIGIFSGMDSHSVARLRQAGVSVGLNTDARLTRAYSAVETAFGWNRADFVAVNRAALHASFAPDAVKRALDQRLDAIAQPLVI